MSLASNLTPVFQYGKDGVTTEFTRALTDVLDARELIKITVLKSCANTPSEIGRELADRTSSELVKVIGRKIILYKQNKDVKKRKIDLNEA